MAKWTLVKIRDMYRWECHLKFFTLYVLCHGEFGAPPFSAVVDADAGRNNTWEAKKEYPTAEEAKRAAIDGARELANNLLADLETIENEREESKIST